MKTTISSSPSSSHLGRIVEHKSVGSREGHDERFQDGVEFEVFALRCLNYIQTATVKLSNCPTWWSFSVFKKGRGCLCCSSMTVFRSTLALLRNTRLLCVSATQKETKRLILFSILFWKIEYTCLTYVILLHACEQLKTVKNWVNFYLQKRKLAISDISKVISFYYFFFSFRRSQSYPSKQD